MDENYGQSQMSKRNLDEVHSCVVGHLKKAMEILISNRKLVTQFGNNGKKHMEEEFDIRKQVHKTQELYKRLMQYAEDER